MTPKPRTRKPKAKKRRWNGFVLVDRNGTPERNSYVGKRPRLDYWERKSGYRCIPVEIREL